MTEKVLLLIPDDMLRAVDEARKGQARVAWIRDAIAARLDNAPEPEPGLFDPELDAAVTRHPAKGAADDPWVTQPVRVTQDSPEGHVHRGESIGNVWYERGQRMTRRRCKDCGAELPPART